MEDAQIEAKKALALAQQKFDAGDLSGAIRFADKSCNIHATAAAKALRKKAESALHAGAEEAKSTSRKEHETQARSRTQPAAKADGPNRASSEKSKEDEAGPSRSYTPAQVTAVKELMVHVKKKDFYAILGIERTSREEMDEDVLKKAYRKKALHFHPDKNAAPGADECFKAIGHAFQVLGDPQKKVIYDQEGADAVNGNSARPSFSGFSHFGQSTPMSSQEINPEDLFNLFFGGGMRGGHPFAMHSNFGGFNAGHFAQTRAQHAGRQHRHAPPQAEGAGRWLAAAPIIIYVIILFFSNILSSLFDASNDSRTSVWDADNLYSGSDVFSLRRSMYYSSARQAETFGSVRPSFYYFVHPSTEATFLKTEVPEQWHPVQVALERNELIHPRYLRRYRLKEEKNPAVWSRADILNFWAQNEYVHTLKKQCREEQRQLKIDLRDATWFFGTKDGNDRRRSEVLQRHRPACDELRNIEETAVNGT